MSMGTEISIDMTANDMRVIRAIIEVVPWSSIKKGDKLLWSRSVCKVVKKYKKDNGSRWVDVVFKEGIRISKQKKSAMYYYRILACEMKAKGELQEQLQ